MLAFGRVQAEQPDLLAGDLQCVAIHNAGVAGQWRLRSGGVCEKE